MTASTGHNGPWPKPGELWTWDKPILLPAELVESSFPQTFEQSASYRGDVFDMHWERLFNVLKPYMDYQADLMSYYSGFPKIRLRLPAGPPPGQAATALTTYRHPVCKDWRGLAFVGGSLVQRIILEAVISSPHWRKIMYWKWFCAQHDEQARSWQRAISQGSLVWATDKQLEDFRV